MNKIAVPYENGRVYGHFGHTSQFKLYTVKDGTVAGSTLAPTLGQGHGALAGFLLAHGGGQGLAGQGCGRQKGAEPGVIRS